MEITVPYDWVPREYQLPATVAFQEGCKRFCNVWHRRAGKDLWGINMAATQVVQRPGLYWHMLPTQRQGRKVVWDGMTRDGRKFLDHFPGHEDAGEPGSFVTRKRDDEMSLWFANGSKYQVVGAEDPDTLVGANPVGVIFSEFSVYNSAAVWNLIRPILVENGGWAIFIFTPRGRNQGYNLFNMAEKHNAWFSEKLGVDDTHAVTEEAIQEEREAGMPEPMIQQEFYCSFDAPLVGSYYGDLMMQMAEDGRIGHVPYDPIVPVDTWWDLGIRDATCQWFTQKVGLQRRLLDFEYSTDVGLDYHVRVLQKKAMERRFVYGEHLFPHDASVRELGTMGGRSRIDTLRKLGVRGRIIQKHPVADGINAVRLMLPGTWIDEKNCEAGIEGLRTYIRRVIQGIEDPDGQAVYSDAPAHTWASHAADALRIGAVGQKFDRGSGPPQKLYPEIAIV